MPVFTKQNSSSPILSVPRVWVRRPDGVLERAIAMADRELRHGTTRMEAFRVARRELADLGAELPEELQRALVVQLRRLVLR